jgi:hypothetical protein
MGFKKICKLVVYIFITGVYTISCIEVLSPETNAEFIKRGILSNLTFGSRYKYLTVLNLVIINNRI